MLGGGGGGEEEEVEVFAKVNLMHKIVFHQMKGRWIRTNNIRNFPPLDQPPLLVIPALCHFKQNALASWI